MNIKIHAKLYFLRHGRRNAFFQSALYEIGMYSVQMVLRTMQHSIDITRSLSHLMNKTNKGLLVNKLT